MFDNITIRAGSNALKIIKDEGLDPAGNMENVVLVAPSDKFVLSLPMGKIPDRKDFYTFRGKDKERQDYWRTVLKENR